MGAEVWGTGGDAGFTIDGSHADYILVPANSLRRKPKVLSFEHAALVGVNFITAWKSLVDAASGELAETVLIIAASGGVGNAGVQIASRLGARIIGTDRAGHGQMRRSNRPDCRSLPMGQGSRQPCGRRPVGRERMSCWICVGGVMFRHALDCLALGGRLVETSVTGAREVSFNLADFYHNENRLIGIDTLKLDLTASAAVLDKLRPGFEDGDYRPAPIARRFALADAVSAYQAVAAGEQGRVLLLPGDAKIKFGAPAATTRTTCRLS